MGSKILRDERVYDKRSSGFSGGVGSCIYILVEADRKDVVVISSTGSLK